MNTAGTEVMALKTKLLEDYPDKYYDTTFCKHLLPIGRVRRKLVRKAKTKCKSTGNSSLVDPNNPVAA